MATDLPQVKRTAVYVYQAPLRAWHWVNALAMTVLAVSGYLIANPLPSLPGEASDHFLMGYIRMLHVYAAIREDIMSRQSLISTMLSGWRMFKDDRP